MPRRSKPGWPVPLLQRYDCLFGSCRKTEPPGTAGKSPMVGRPPRSASFMSEGKGEALILAPRTAAMSARRVALGRRQSAWVADTLPAGQEPPTDAYDLVRQGDDGDVLVGSRLETIEPGPGAAITLHVHARRSGAVDEKPAQGAVAMFRHAEQRWLAAVACWRGTTSSHAARSRPRLKPVPSATVATSAACAMKYA